jgi:hypothetical protein
MLKEISAFPWIAIGRPRRTGCAADSGGFTTPYSACYDCFFCRRQDASSDAAKHSAALIGHLFLLSVLGFLHDRQTVTGKIRLLGIIQLPNYQILRV